MLFSQPPEINVGTELSSQKYGFVGNCRHYIILVCPKHPDFVLMF